MMIFILSLNFYFSNNRVLKPVKYIERKAENFVEAKSKIYFEGISEPKEIEEIQIKEKISNVNKRTFFTTDHAVCVDNYNQSYPSLSTDSRGYIYIAMDYFNGSTYEIDLYRSIDNGDNFELLLYLYHPSYNYRFPHIVIDNRDTIFVFYETNDTRYGFQYLSSPDGNNWTIYYVSAFNFYPDSCEYPRAATKDTLIYVTFMFDYYGNGSDYDVGYVYSVNRGLSWYGYRNRIANTARHERFPVVSISDSVVGVAYEFNNILADTDSFDIYYKYDRNQSNNWTLIYGIATYHNDRYPDLKADKRYMYIACQRNYYTKPSRDWDIWMRKSSNGGKSWDGASFYPASTSYEEKFPSIFCKLDTMFLGYVYKDSLILYAETTAVSNNWFADTVSDLKSAVSEFRTLNVLKNENQRMVVWTDYRNIGIFPNIGYDIYFSTDYPLTNLPDISIYKPLSWFDCIVPSKIRGTNFPSETLLGSNGNDSVYIDFALISNSPVDVRDTIYISLYVDGILEQVFFSPPLPTGWYARAEDYATLIMGGRHTISYYNDYLDSIKEIYEDNNDYGKQFVFFPLILNDKIPGIFRTPPYPYVSFTPNDTFNCDGFRISTQNRWCGVALKPPANSDYNLRLYDDHYLNYKTGFSSLRKESNYSTGEVDFILIDGNHFTEGTFFYPGVYMVNGNGDYIIEYNSGDYTLNPGGWIIQDTLKGGSIIKVYDANLSVGNKYYIAIKETLTDENLGFAIFSSEDGNYIKSRGEWVGFRDTITINVSKDTSYIPTTSDIFSIVVWNNNPSSKGDAIYKIYISSVPLVIELTEFFIDVKGNEVFILWNSPLDVDKWFVKRKNLNTNDSVIFNLKNSEKRFVDRIDFSGNYKYYFGYEKGDKSVILKEEDITITLKTFLLSNIVFKDIKFFMLKGTDYSIEIYSINGSLVWSKKYFSDKVGIHKFELNIPKGIYFIVLNENEKILIKEKLMKLN